MPYASHCRAICPVPHYGLDHATQSSHLRPNARSALARTFRRAQMTHTHCSATEPRTLHGHRGRHPSRPQASPHTVWPAAFAALFIANLISSASGDAAPGTPPRESARMGNEPAFANMHAVAIDDAPTSTPAAPIDAVRVSRIEIRPVKSKYTLVELLEAIAASSHPFRHTGHSLAQLYTMLTGHAVDADTLKAIERWTDIIDFTTGLIPNVGASRVPGDIAGLASDQIGGRPLDMGRVTGLLQTADVRNWQSRGIVRSRPDFAEMFRQRQIAAGRHKGAVGVVSRPLADRPYDAASGNAIDAESGLPPAEYENVDSSPFRPMEAAFAANVGGNDASSSIPDWHIEGELEHLQGYAQSLPHDRLAPGTPRRLTLVDGRHYLKGDAGYYHATRGQSYDHWLVSAPRGSEHAAQVPVHYDAATGKWQAEAPLRLCGGGCGPSRESTPDSIAVDRDRIANAVSHLRDEHTREGIRYAFDDLSLLHLTRSNRPDMKMMRDNSIINHRAILQISAKSIKRDAPLLKQQEDVSLITATHYYWNPYAEAFCQENSEILFHYLLANSIPPSRIRMITVQPKNRPPHVMVLYTESEQLVGLLESSTPQPPLNFEPDGVNDMLFAHAIYESRDSTVLLDPWSRVRATSFVHANNAIDLVDTLDRALAEIGHRPGNMYRVSITRPLAVRRGSASSLGSLGSSGSGRARSSSRSTSLGSGSTASGSANQPGAGTAV